MDYHNFSYLNKRNKQLLHKECFKSDTLDLFKEIQTIPFMNWNIDRQIFKAAHYSFDGYFFKEIAIN